MPPVSKAGGSAFRKDVEFVTKDDDEQIAAGVVMVPDKVDLQNDYAREETIREFADQFEAFVEAGEAGGGIMHAVFPDGWMDLERNEVLDEATDIGGTEAPAGAWVQEWRINDADLWSLITDSVIAGYSIGAIQVGWDGPYEQGDEDIDDVEVPADIPDDELVWELVSGIIREVSAVDIPAVPDAQILETKADSEKRLGDYLGNREGFIEEALQRGHDESEAGRMWDVLNRAVDSDGSGEPGEKGFFRRVGKAAVDVVLGEDPDVKSHTAETPDTDPRKGREKDGQVLSRKNRHSEMASIDASLDVLEDAGVDHGMSRFTDREEYDFDLSEHTAREWPKPDDEEDEEEDSSPFNIENEQDAPGGETPDNTETKDSDMTDDNTGDSTDDPMADAPEWAKAINGRIDELESEKNADVEEDADPLDDAPEWAKSLVDRVDEVEEKALGDDTEDERPEWAKDLEDRIDTISQQSGVSTQLEAGADGEGGDEEDGLAGLGKALS